MLDFDAAALYGTETRILKQAVKRNKMNFPKDFMFQLNKKEWHELITTSDNLP
ncbi:MAG: ORF6N domain-containing protein, partial [Chitinophagaceae bacterium]|nr:ORF6N domain-containing protein [Chitinophagaceae bacterium]